jgi:membrane fusion protein (multidrug efflux system)
MVDGFPKVRPGAPVKPLPWNAGGPAGAPTPGAAPGGPALPASAAAAAASAASGAAPAASQAKKG